MSFKKVGEWESLPAEGDAKHPQQCSQHSSLLSRLDPSDRKVGKGAGEEHEHQQEKEDQESADLLIVRCRVLHKADGVVPTKVHDCSHESIPHHFDENVGQNEG